MYLRSMNCCLKDLCEICGYKSMKPYIDITEAAKRDAINKMEEAFVAAEKVDTGR